MTMTTNPHILFFPSPGMGHLVHFLRLASLLSSRNCNITFVNPKLTPCRHDSTMLSAFFSSHPHIKPLEFLAISTATTTDTSSATLHDAFITQFRAINSSVHLLPPLLSSLPQPPISAVFSDFVMAASLTRIRQELGVPIYIVSTTSARCYSTIACLPGLLSSEQPSNFDDNNISIPIPGLPHLPKSLVPPSWLDKASSNQLLNEYLVPNSQSLSSLDGVLLNSFNFFERDTIGALIEGKVLSSLPPLYPIGPFVSYKIEKDHGISWLDDQMTSNSVVYVNFGTRAVMSVDQMRELGKGLAKSGFPFLWVLHQNEDLLGSEILDCVKDKGLLTSGCEVNQAAVLAHRAIGGFVNQCEWAAVSEAAWEGVPMLAWPQHGDHKMNAEVVEKAGMGIWVKDWGWGGERLVRGEEIGERVKELIGDEKLRAKAKEVGEEARKGWEVGGSSETALVEVIQMLRVE